MFKKLRNKFIWTNMITATVIIVIAFASIFFATAVSHREPVNMHRESTESSEMTERFEEVVKNDRANRLQNLGFTLIAVGLMIEFLVFGVSYYLSERAVTPVKQAYEKQKEFIANASHELKTPIALIQGYSEGLIENVNSDEESRKFYADVILDEANKMDTLVKKLLELMKLEYGEREFHDEEFDIAELIREIIRNSKVVLDEQKIKVNFSCKEPKLVIADIFYIEQVVRNYFTNAIKNVKELNGKKQIKISVKPSKTIGNLKVTVFNTGDNISDENLERIWKRFYKLDESRNRESGGTGIGLALVKAIMNQYGNAFGVVNKKDGVEFYFEIKTP